MVGKWTRGLQLLVRSFAPAAFAVSLVALCDGFGGRVLPAGSLVRGAVSEVVFCAAFTPWVRRAVRSLRS
jgi:hypothetical protein